MPAPAPNAPLAMPARPGPPAAAAPAEAASPVPAERLAAIRQRGQMLVCIWPESMSISWRNPRSAELEGLDIDMARFLANRLAVRPVFVETTLTEIFDRLDRGDCDIAMTGVGVTPARAQRVAFSKPYLASPVVAVSTRESGRVTSWQDIDRPGIAVAVTAGSYAEPMFREALKQAELVVLRPPVTREQELLAGRVDVFITDYPYARKLAQLVDWARVIDPPARFGETLYAYAVPKGDLAWLNEVNAFLAAVKIDGSLARFATKYGLTPVVLY
jgi:ABC-type amino acid transport substrate-binding protein